MAHLRERYRRLVASFLRLHPTQFTAYTPRIYTPMVSASDVVCSAIIGFHGHVLCREIMSFSFANDGG